MKKIEEEFELDDIIDALTDNVKEDVKDFNDVINLDGALNREIFIGDVVAGLGQTVDAYIRFWNKKDNEQNIPVADRKPIRIYIDSCGGSLTDAFTIIDAINLSETPIHTIVTGSAYSAGFFISITGHKRYAYPLASFLYHEGSATNGGTANQFQNFTEFYKKQLKQLKVHTLACTKMDEDFYENIKRDDYWMTAEEALALGCFDEICESLR